MELKEQVLKMLIEGETSGGKIALKLGVSRAAVWKCVESLRAEGYNISAVTGRGYVLGDDFRLSTAKVAHFLSTPWTVEVYDAVTSTSDIVKEKAALHSGNYAAIADSQTSGRGRLGRKFSSPKGSGLYMTALMHPMISMSDCGKVTAYAGVVTARAIEKLCKIKVDIKWVNDLFISGKKVCGILTESSVSLESGLPEYIAVGIGVNVTGGALPKELKEIATTLEDESGDKVDRCALAALILDGLSEIEPQLESDAFLAEYRARSCILGKNVLVNNSYRARAVAINDDCSLVIERDGKPETLSAGEVSLKLSV